MDALLHGKQVLIVEDEVLISMLLGDMLTDLGCQTILEAHDLETAVAVLDTRLPELCILDLRLNDVLSYPVAEMLTARGVPIIFSTGYGKDHIGGRWNHCLTLFKPYDVFQLNDAIKSTFQPM